MNDLGTTIMNLRKERGMTQEQLANALSISFQAVSKWETGNSCPDISALPLLADLFGVSIDRLFGRESTLPVPAQAEPERREESAALPWPDDEGFYAVLYHGHELIGSTGENRPQFRFQYEGPAQDVNCAFDLEITGSVYGDVSADGDVTCDDVAGNVSASGSVTCDDVAGNVSAGDSVTCDDVTGNVSAGGSVACDDVAGSVFGGGAVHAGGEGSEVHFESGRDSARLGETLSDLGERISAAVEKAARKGWSFHRSWPFGEGQVRVDLDLEDDEEE